MRQVAILPSGCQEKTIGLTLHFDEDRIFYASTLAVYIINATTFVLEKIISLNHKAIVSISISPHDSNLMVVSGMDGSICLWNVEKEEILSKIQITTGANLVWNPHSKLTCAIIANEATLKMYSW